MDACFSLQDVLLTRCMSAKLFRRVLGRGIRYGEAQNPGPAAIQFGICNPTSLTNKTDAFQALTKRHQCHFIGAAETSATKPVQVTFGRQMRKSCYFSAFTPAAPSLRARADHQISRRGKATGCACFSVTPVRQPRCPPLQDSGMDLRSLHVIADDWQLQIVILYGLAQSNPGAQEFNEQLLALAAQRVQQVNLPAIIMGDLNSDVFKMSTTSLLARRGFLHLQQVFQAQNGYAMPPTCKDATNPDTAFLSAELIPRLHNIHVLQEPLFDAHKVILFSLTSTTGNLYKQVWPRPRPFTDFPLTLEQLEAADKDLQQFPVPRTLEEWGTRVEQTVDVALRKLPVGANMPRSLPKAFQGRCQPQKPKCVLVTSMTPKARHGEFEPAHEVHCVATAGMIKQLRRIQSLKRKLNLQQDHSALVLEWRCILRFRFRGRSFVNWMSSMPELFPVPWKLPHPSWLYDLDQLWRHEVQSAVQHDHKVFCDKLACREQLDAKQGHHKLAFASVRGFTPSLESVEQHIEQQAILVPLSCRVQSKSHQRYEAFVEDAAEFQKGQSLQLDHQQGWLHDTHEHSIIVSCPKPPQDLNNVRVQQGVLVTDPDRICQHLSSFWQPIWQRDDSHLLCPELDTEFEPFVRGLPKSPIVVNTTDLQLWKLTINKLRWNAAPGQDGITAFELQSLPDALIQALISLIGNYQDGFPSWFMASKVIAAPKGTGVPMPSKT